MPIVLLAMPAFVLLPSVPEASQPLPAPALAVASVGQIELPQAERELRLSLRTDQASASPKPVEFARPLVASEPMQVRRRSRAGRVGDLGWALEVERARAPTLDRPGAGSAARHRSLAVNAALAWDVGGGDRLSAQTGFVRDKRPDRFASGDQAIIGTRTLIADVAWSHGNHWRLDAGWRGTTSSAKTAGARLTDLAGGAVPPGRQVQLQFSFAPTRVDLNATFVMGINASAGRRNGFGNGAIGSNRQRERSAVLFAQLSF